MATPIYFKNAEENITFQNLQESYLLNLIRSTDINIEVNVCNRNSRGSLTIKTINNGCHLCKVKIDNNTTEIDTLNR